MENASSTIDTTVQRLSFQLKLSTAVCLITFVLVGSAGNVMVLWIFQKTPTLAALMGRQLLQNLAFSDLLICLTCTLSIVLRALLGATESEGDKPFPFWLGRFHLSSCAALHTTMTSFVAGVSLVRNVECFGPEIIKLHRKTFQYSYAGVAWCIGIVIFCFNMRFVDATCSTAPFCIGYVNVALYASPTSFNTLLMVLTGLLYYRLYRRSAPLLSDEHTAALMKSSFTIWLCLVVTNGTFLLAMWLGTHLQLPPAAYAFIMVFGSINGSNNVFVYWYFSSTFRAKIRNICRRHQNNATSKQEPVVPRSLSPKEHDHADISQKSLLRAHNGKYAPPKARFYR